MKGIFSLLFIITPLFQFGQLQDQDFSPYTQNIPGTNVSIEMVPIPGGTFLMGSPETEFGRDDDEGPQHHVSVNPFWMGQYEVTWEQYDLFVEEDFQLVDPENRFEGDVISLPSPPILDALSLPSPPYMDPSSGMGKAGFPAVNMTHYAAVMYAKWLTAKTGHFYRLPTEAEWEYACRSGSKSAYHFGDDPIELNKYAWFYANSNQTYREVGTLNPNAYGLYDMLGNVAEWTMDQYYDDYYKQLEGEVADSPWFKPNQLYPRSVRGGSWRDDPEELRCANRRGSIERWKQRDPQLPKSLWWNTDASFVGFRLVRPKETPSVEEMENYWIKAIQEF
ncbi:MAG: formylglycine-generating enzyme family protein [Balneolales bacterium]